MIIIFKGFRLKKRDEDEKEEEEEEMERGDEG